MADEPTGNIDPETSYHLIELLKDICDSGKTVIIATHQYDLITKFPGRVFRCENGTILEDHSFSEIVAENPPLSEEEIENIVESNPEILTRNPENETSTVEECVINTTGNNMPVERRRYGVLGTGADADGSRKHGGRKNRGLIFNRRKTDR